MSNANMMLEITDNPNLSTNDFVVARNIAEKLHSHYPGHLWAVTCDGKTGMASVRNLRFSGNWGYQIRLSELFGDPDMRVVVKAGGEILERFWQLRGKYNHDRAMDLPNLPNGVPIFDHEASKTRAPVYVIEAVDRARRLRPE